MTEIAFSGVYKQFGITKSFVHTLQAISVEQMMKNAILLVQKYLWEKVKQLSPTKCYYLVRLYTFFAV